MYWFDESESSACSPFSREVFGKRDWQKCFYGQFINLKHLKENFDIFGGGKGDHRQSENRTLNGNWTLLSYQK